MPQLFTSLEDFLAAVLPGAKDVKKQIDILNAVKDGAGGGGMGRLLGQVEAAFGAGERRNLERAASNLPEILQDLAFEARHGSSKAKYQGILSDFLRASGFEFEAAKKENNGPQAPRAAAPKAAEPQRPAAISGSPEQVESEFDELKEWCQTGATLSLFSKGGPDRIESGEMVMLPSILPPPPAGADPKQLSQWLNGGQFSDMAPSIRLDLVELNVDDIIEMESNLYANPEATLRDIKARPSVDMGKATSEGEALFYAGKDLGFRGVSYEAAGEAFTSAVKRYYEQFEPKYADFLKRAGWEVKADQRLLAAVGAALNIEAFFIEDAPEHFARGDAANIRGALSPHANLKRPYVLDRSMVLYFGGHMSLPEAMSNVLLEYRHAQTCRFLKKDIDAARFDRVYFEQDMFYSLTEVAQALGETAPTTKPAPVSFEAAAPF